MKISENCADNLFFHRDYRALRFLLLVPHQDDEINTAAALLSSLSKSGADIIIVYTTNGDWKYPAETRMREAVNAIKLLGVKDANIIFLGYGDSINDSSKRHLFYHEDCVTSPSGHKETYGGRSFPDFAFSEKGKHQPYTNRNFLSDMIDVIRKYRPDVIACTDFDEHPDHRMLSLYLDKAIGSIRRCEPSYTPEIWKRFAYATAYTAEADYSAINNPETRRPEVGKTGKYGWEFIDSSIYLWENRIRIPIPEEMRIGNLKKNLLGKALRQHKSQYIITKADRIINSDEVYWSRRTDSLTYCADISVSSGEGHYLNDAMIYDTEDVDSVVPDLSGHCWKPEADDLEKKAIFRWNTPQHVEKIVLYGEITDQWPDAELVIGLSDGYETVVRDVPTNGNPVTIDTGAHDGVTECSIRFVKFSGAGLTELEIYAEKEKQSLIQPFVKILMNQNFSYEYVVDLETQEIDVGLYRYGAMEGSVIVERGNSKLVDGKLLLNPDDDEILLRAITEDGTVVDQVVIHRKSRKEMSKLEAVNRANSRYLRSMRRKQKIHNMFYILFHSGVRAVVKRIIKR